MANRRTKFFYPGSEILCKSVLLCFVESPNRLLSLCSLHHRLGDFVGQLNSPLPALTQQFTKRVHETIDLLTERQQKDSRNTQLTSSSCLRHSQTNARAFSKELNICNQMSSGRMNSLIIRNKYRKMKHLASVVSCLIHSLLDFDKTKPHVDSIRKTRRE